MKMVKKILLGMTVAAAVLAFVGCKPPTGGSSDEIEETSAFSKAANIDTTNSGTTLMRGFKALNTKHLDAILHITNTVNKITSPTSNLKTNGVMGYIFNMNEAQTSFTIAAVRYNQYTGTVDAYVETYKDVDPAKLEEADFTNGVKATGSPTYSDGFGFTLVNKATVDALLASKVGTADEGKLDIWIDVIANDGTSVGRKGTAGSYTVRFFGEDPQRTKKLSNGLEYKNADATVLKEVTVEADNVNNPFKKTGETKGKLTNMQSYMGYYYNIQAGQTLTGNWKFDALKMEAEEIEE